MCEGFKIKMIGEFYQFGFDACTGLRIFNVYDDKIKEEVKKLVFLNALIPADGYLIYTRKIDIETLKKLLNIAKPEIISFIGHQSTAELLTNMLKVEIPANRGMWKPEKKEEFAVVIRLKKRLAKPEDVKSVTENDMEVWWVHYYKPSPKLS